MITLDRNLLSRYKTVSQQEQGSILKQLNEIANEYPASSMINFIYLQLLRKYEPGQYEKTKGKLLLSIPDREKFNQFRIENIRIENEETNIKKDVKDVRSENIGAFQKERIIEAEKEVVFTKRLIEKEDEEAVLDHLIDQFSNDPPKIHFDPERHDAATNYGSASLIEDPNLVSETLAIIYAGQGYYGKAIKMYKKLGLQFPEKSCYFANQIKQIKKNKENNI